MCVAGLPQQTSRHASDACNAALDIREYMARTNIARSRLGLPCWNIRIGIHTGGVIAGVVGKKKFTYDVWGDAVNTAALMEAHAEPGTILLSDSTFGHLHGDFETVFRGEINTAKKGSLRCYVLNDRKGKATG
jgi:class 3 adenylate cyclase